MPNLVIIVEVLGLKFDSTIFMFIGACKRDIVYVEYEIRMKYHSKKKNYWYGIFKPLNLTYGRC